MRIRLILKQLQTSLSALLILMILFGLLYPGLITLILQSCCHFRANGSMVSYHSKSIGSELIGQHFTQPEYFWGRPSATNPLPYDPLQSQGSNLSTNNPTLLIAVQNRVKTIKQAEPENPFPIPVDLVTSSGSGLDPHISIASAYFQINRVSRARKMDPIAIKMLVDQYTTPRTLGFIGEPCVNVLLLNLALDRVAKGDPSV